MTADTPLQMECEFFAFPEPERCWDLETGGQLDPMLLEKTGIPREDLSILKIEKALVKLGLGGRT